MRLNIVGGHAALNLVNTVEPRLRGVPPERDHIAEPNLLLDWSAAAGVVDGYQHSFLEDAWRENPKAAERAGEDVRLIREHLSDALNVAMNADGDGAGDDLLNILKTRYVAALKRNSLQFTHTKPHMARYSTKNDGATLLGDLLVSAAVDLLTTKPASEMKECPPEQGGCGWVFLDASRNRTRVWCSMDDCGARVKASRLTARRRTDRAARGQLKNIPPPSLHA